MPINARDYLHALREGRDPFERSMTEQTQKCATCGVPLQEALTGFRKFGEQVLDSDHYFEELSAMVDAHPVGLPRSSGRI